MSKVSGAVNITNSSSGFSKFTKSSFVESCGRVAARRMGVQTTAQFVDNSRVFAVSASATAAATAASAGPMQKSKSSSSVMHHGSRLIAKKMFRSRSKSQTRPNQVPCSWTPQGSCIWTSVSGKQVILNDSTLLQLSEVERKVLQKVAVAKLQALNLGVNVKVPADNIGAPISKPKRRPYLLKRKALTTGIFDSGRKDSDSKDKDSTGGTGLVFGIPLAQCVENDRVARGGTLGSSGGGGSGASSATGGGTRDSSSDDPTINRISSRASFSSLIEASRAEEKGSCESLLSPRDRMVGSVPGLLDSLGRGESTGDLALGGALAVDEDPAVPAVVNSCIRYLEVYGMHTLGIFRVSASKKRIRQLREDIDCGKDSFQEEDQTPHDIATLLKEYLRDLPDPLLCRDLYQAFVQTQRIRNRKLQHEALQHLIQLLPVVNRDTLWTLINFLATVAKNAPDQRDASGEIIQGNKMDSNNLATVFAPNILHCIKPGSKEISDKPEDRLDIINVIRALVDHNKSLFTISSELLDEVYVHMMDSHPEALDQLLNKRDTNEESLEDLDSESQSNSAPWTPTAVSADITIEHALQKLQDEANGKMSSEPRKTWSREEFLHESAATGGPNIGMRIRSKDRVRERGTKKRRDESTSRRKRDEDSGGSNSSLTAMSIISRLRGTSSRDEDASGTKTRSSSLDSNASVPATDIQDTMRILRVSSEDDHNRGIITASLTIPLSVTNPDDDIPYIEDGYNNMDPGKQHMTIGLVKTTTTVPAPPPRRRQRSMSGSDSSVASVQPVTGSIVLGYDSAVGSSATYSSPPHYTTPSSVGSSIAQDGGVYSSPPSWASTPPTSPDSQSKAVNYIPDDIIHPPTRYHAKTTVTSSLRKDPAVAQRVSLSSTPEVQQIRTGRPADVARSYQKDSPTSSGMSTSKRDQYTPAITSIGNAVLRSRTADFERISKADTKTKTTTSTTMSDKKKYTKRRYTDSRHQTRHIPDSESLDNTTQVYKRKELISSVLSK